MFQATVLGMALPYRSMRLVELGSIKSEQGVLLVEKEASLKTLGTVSFLALAHLLVIEIAASKQRHQACSSYTHLCTPCAHGQELRSGRELGSCARLSCSCQQGGSCGVESLKSVSRQPAGGGKFDKRCKEAKGGCERLLRAARALGSAAYDGHRAAVFHSCSMHEHQSRTAEGRRDHA